MLDGPLCDVGEREFKFGPADFRAIAAVLRQVAGITLPDGKAPLVYARLVKRLRVLNIPSFADYVALLHGPDSAAERAHLLTALTTNVTGFFRESHHFDHLRNQLRTAASPDSRVRLWSAACSTGQEPYSIAAVLAETIPNAAQRDIKILATDIDPMVVERARNGRFDSIEGVPPSSRRWFERSGDGWAVDPALRKLITFKVLNLNGSWPFRGPFDVIFCRNVVIYFDQETQSRLWRSFADVMCAEAVLYIGHSERVSGPASENFETTGITTYRRRSDIA